jgi:hypothetical protein
MNSQIYREIYSNNDYPINPQEEKGNITNSEFLMSLKDPYWLIRSQAYTLDLPLFGEKSSLKQNMEILLFNSSIDYSNILPTSADCKKTSSIDLFEKRYGKAGLETSDGIFT